VDFADVKAIMRDTGSALMGIGVGSGESRALDAAKAAISSPLLELSIDGARGILFTITGGTSLGMQEVAEAAKVITNSADDNVKVIFGAVIDESMGEDVRITVIATGFEDRDRKAILSEQDSNAGFGAKKSYYSSTFFAKKKSDVRDDREEAAAVSSSTPAAPIVRTGFTTKSLGAEEPTVAPTPTQKSSTPPTDEPDIEIPAFIRKKMGM
jgi:cell division protein FtsZ